MTEKHKASMVLALTALADISVNLSPLEFIDFIAELRDEFEHLTGRDRAAMIQAAKSWVDRMPPPPPPPRLSEAETLKAVAEDMRNVGRDNR